MELSSDAQSAGDNLFSSDLLIHIGRAELISTLPTASEATRQLYKQIAERDSKLAKLRPKLLAVTSLNDATKGRVTESNKRVFNLEASLNARTSQLEQDKERQSLAGTELTRILRETQAVEGRISKTEAQIVEIEQKLQRQAELHTELTNEVDHRHRRRELITHRLENAQLEQKKLNETIHKDAKMVKEMEVYLRRVTKQLYDRQREVDQLRLGQLDAKSEAEGIKRLTKQLDKHLLTATAAAEDEVILTRISKEREQLKETQDHLLKLESKDSQQRKQWVEAVEAELESRSQLAEVATENDIISKRIERMKSRLEELQQEKPPPMYRTYKRSLDEEGTFELMSIDQLRELISIREKELEALTQKLKQEEQRFNRKMAIFKDPQNDEDDVISDPAEITPPPPLPLPVNNNPFQDALQAMEKQREGILDECAKEAVEDLEGRRRQLNLEVDLLSNEARAKQTQTESIRKAIERENERLEDLNDRINQIKESAPTPATAAIEDDNDRLLLEQQELERELEKWSHSIEDLESLKSQLTKDLLQAEVDENNARNRFHTYDSMRKSKRSGIKELARTEKMLAEWEQRVAVSTEELQSLRNVLELAKQRNIPTRESLKALNPFSDEAAEYEALEHRRRQLKRELGQLSNATTTMMGGE